VHEQARTSDDQQGHWRDHGGGFAITLPNSAGLNLLSAERRRRSWLLWKDSTCGPQPPEDREDQPSRGTSRFTRLPGEVVLAC
jgi:hypothetical protein